MNSTTKLAALSKFKSSPSVVMRQPVTKILVIYDVHVQEISQIPLIINYGETRFFSCLFNLIFCSRFTESRRGVHSSVSAIDHQSDYLSLRSSASIGPAVAPNNYSRGGVIINFVTATGGDVEMLRSIECFHK